MLKIGIIALAFLIILTAVIGSSLLKGGDEWDRIAHPYSFNIIRWEFENLFDKWGYKAVQVFHPDELSEAERSQTVEDYLSLNQEIHPLEATLTREKSEGIGSAEDIAIKEARLVALKAERARLENQSKRS